MAVLTPQQTQIVREWATANGLNPNIQVNEAEKLLQSGAYPSFDALAEAARMARDFELSEMQAGRDPYRQEMISTNPVDILQGSTREGVDIDIINQRLAFGGQPIDNQMRQIRAWFAQNPNASQEQIQSAMDQYGVSPQTVALAMGNTRLPNAPASIQVAQYQNITGNRGDINDINRAIVARNLGVSADELASLGGMDLAQAQALTGRAAEQNPLAGKVSTDQIRAYIAANPNISDQQIAAMMTQYGVTPIQLSQATGVDVGTINQRLGNAVQAGAETIPTGLAGFEQALTTGLNTATGTLRGAETAARGDLGASMEEVARLYGLNIDDLRAAQTNAQAELGRAAEASRGLYGQNIAGIESALAAARGDLGTAMDTSRGLFGQNVSGIEAAGQLARGDIERTYGQAGGMFSPYQQAGTTALQQQLALSGALGPEAFQRAYVESPYIQFLREQGERSTLAGAAATGGLGGGRVQQELVRFGQGLASQGLQQQIQNLSGLSGMGMQAAGAGADILTGMGTNLANLGTGTAQNIAAQRAALAGLEQTYGTNLANLGTSAAQNIAAQRGALADIETQYGTNLANLFTGTAQNIAGQRQNLAGERSQYGVNLANLASSTGTNVANLQAQAALNTANQRARAGEMLAGQIGDTTVNLANLGTSQGTNLANLLSQYGTAGLNLSQTYTADQIAAAQQAAQEEAAAQQGLAINQASALAGQPFAQAQPFSYGQAFGNALNAAALGYDLAGGRSGQQMQGTGFMQGISPSARMIQGGGQQVPQGYINPGTGQPFNVFSTNLLAARLGGVR